MLYVLGFGSRGWTDDHWVGVVMQDIARAYEGEIRILHGDARGADLLCGKAAETLGWRVKAMPADWGRHGRRAAGPIRNHEMADLLIERQGQGHEVMARGFCTSWPKLTRGSTHMATLLDLAFIPHRVYGPMGEVYVRHEERE